MAHPSPLAPLHTHARALLGPYGPPPPAVPIDIVEAFDPIEIEYAALRRHAAIFDFPHTAILEFTGADRIAFLNRMLTQELKGLPEDAAVRAFWLNRKGRIDADLLIINQPGRTLALVDAFAAERTRTELDKYIITEEVAITDRTADLHVLDLHGPAAPALVARIAAQAALAEIQPGRVAAAAIAGTPVVLAREDWAGVPGLHLVLPATHARAVYDALSTPWDADPAAHAYAPATDLARRIGWHALNIARLEAGSALYMIDFGPDSLPHETGDAALAAHVSFKKGCYLGQEIVARMHALGHPKQKLVNLRISGPSPTSTPTDHQPITGTPLLAADDPSSPAIGAITSSAFSPLLSQQPIALAMVKFNHSAPGATVFAQLDSARLIARVT